MEALLVADLQDAQRLVHAETVTPRIRDRLVAREDCHEAVGVPRFRSEHDAAPVAADSDRADPVIEAVVNLLKMRARMGLTAELANSCVHGLLDSLLQLQVLREEILGDGQPRHRGLQTRV